MRIFKCIFSGSECLCDNDRPLPEKDGMYVVPGKQIELGEETIVGVSNNVDEDAAEGATAEAGESQKQKVIDIVHYNRLEETSFTKAAYMAYIKGYMKNLMEKLKEGGADEATTKQFAANAQTFVKMVVGCFDDWQFFYPTLESDEADYDTAMCILCRWEEDGTKPTFYYWKDGLKGEKV